MSIKFVKARRIEELEVEANKLIEQGYSPLEGGFLEETNPDTNEKFIIAMVKKPATTPAPAPAPQPGGGEVVTPQAGRLEVPVATEAVKKKKKKTTASRSKA
jgi:hypothetical protein